jgi:CHASE3 domain sensor protein
MKNQYIIGLSIIISFSIAMIISFLITNRSQTTNNNLTSFINTYTTTKQLIGNTEDIKGDTQPIELSKDAIIPEIHSYRYKIYSNKQTWR